MERVRAAVEEEERQAAAAADTRAAAAAIATAAEAAKVIGQVSTALKADGDKQVEDQPEKPSEGASDVALTSRTDQNVRSHLCILSVLYELFLLYNRWFSFFNYGPLSCIVALLYCYMIIDCNRHVSGC